MAISDTQLTTQNTAVWYLDEPGGTKYLLDCIDIEDLSETLAPITPLFRWNDDRTAKVVMGETIGDPEKIGFTLVFPRFLARKIIEQGDNCPGALIWGQKVCGRPDDFAGIQIGEIIQHVKREGRSFSGVSHRSADNPTDVSLTLGAWPPLLDIDTLEIARVATTEAQDLNDVFGNDWIECSADCGTTKSLGEFAAITPDAAGGASGNELFSTDFGETWAAGAVDPFGVGLNTMAGTVLNYNGGRRWIVGREGTGAVQGLMAYSDNAGAAWTTANIGGAAVGHGPTYGHGVFSLHGDPSRVWCASADGYIYKSIDAGVSWVAKKAGAIHVGANAFVHFADSKYGLVGGAAGVISLSDDGGESWYAGGIPAASSADCGWRFDERRCLVGLANGALYRSIDGGLTWTLLTTGIPANVMRSMWFANDYQGFLACNIGGLGYIYKTNDGGASWQALTYVTNAGLNSVWCPTAPYANLVYAVGAASGGTGVILKVNSAY